MLVLRNDAPAAFGRLCVETRNTLVVGGQEGPAAFGRLCVETEAVVLNQEYERSSRLRAAVC